MGNIEKDCALRASNWNVPLTLVFLFAFTSSILTAIADSLSIRHEGSELVTSPGINVTLACVVRGSGYNYFYHQVVWYKVMASDGGEGEDVQINTGAIINPPFLATGRYTVEPDVSTQQQIVSVPLSIRDVSLEDNGTYRCDLVTTNGISGTVTHTLSVNEPSEVVLFINKTDSSGGAEGEELTRPRPHYAPGIHIVELAEFEPVYVSCRSVGGYPAPQLRLFLGDEDISSEFIRHEEERRTGARGLEVVTMVTELVRTDYSSGMEGSRKLLRCVASGPATTADTPQLHTEQAVELRVLYPPSFQCDSVREATIHVRQFKIDCKVMANPPIELASIAWLIPATNGTLLRNGEAWNGYSVEAWRHQRDAEAVQTTLTIDSVGEGAYQTYGVRVKNAMEDKVFHIRLQRATKANSRPIQSATGGGRGAASERSRSDQEAARMARSGATIASASLCLYFCLLILQASRASR